MSLTRRFSQESFGIIARQRPFAIVERRRNDLGQMQRAPVGRLCDLLAATEAVGDDQRVFRGAANVRQ